MVLDLISIGVKFLFYEFISYESILGTEILPQGKFKVCARDGNE